MNRKAFLRTSMGVAALPWMESIVGAAEPASGSTSPSTPPARFVSLFFPNGVYPSSWQTAKSGDRLEFGGTLEPLSPFSDRAVTFSGIDHPLGGHLGQTAGFLSGIDFSPNEEGIVTGGTSLDQMLAQKWKDETFLPSLHLALEPPSQGGFGNRPKSYGNSISWSSPTSKIEPQLSPRQAFDQVFFGQSESGRQAAARRRRIVDEVWGQAKDLRKKVSRFDQGKLDQYLDSISDLEAKLVKAMNPQEKSWTPPTAVELQRPTEAGIPSSFAEHLDLMMDVLLLSLQTDSTRVGTLVMGHSISRVVYDFVDSKLTRNHHDYSHHRNDPQKIAGYNLITEWLASKAAEMLERMDAIDEGNASLLDNSIVLFGSGMKDGNTHEPLDIPVALFGSGGGRLKTNRHLECPKGTILAQMHLSLLQLFGIEAENFNGVTNTPLPQLA